MKELTLTICILLLLFVAHSQENTNTIERNTEWTLLQELDGVKQYYKFQECNMPSEGLYREYVFLKLVNSTDEAKIVSWDNVMWFGDKCVNCEEKSDEEYRVLIIKPNSTLEGGCPLNTLIELKIFSKFLNYDFQDWELSNFELRNFLVIKSNSQQTY